MADIAISNLPSETSEPLAGDMLGIDDLTAGETKKVPYELVFGGNVYIPDRNETDQGVSGSGKTIKTYVDAIGSDKGTIFLRHCSGGATTTYTLTTSETIPENITLIIEPGAIIDGAGTLTISGPFKAAPVQAFGSSIVVAFGTAAKGTLSPQMWDDDCADGVTNASTAINAMLASLPATGGLDVYFPNGTYKCDDALSFTDTYPITINMGADAHFTGTGALLRNVTNTNNKIAGGTYKRLTPNSADNTRLGANTAIQTGVWEIVPDADVDNAYSVAGYFGARGVNGASGDIWALNPLIELQSGFNGNGISVEVNVNNSSGADGAGSGVVINGVGTNQKLYGVSILSSNATSDWQVGVRITDFVDGLVVDGAGSQAPSRGIRILGLSSDHIKIESSDDLNPAYAHACGVDSNAAVMWKLTKSGIGSFLAGIQIGSVDGTMTEKMEVFVDTDVSAEIGRAHIGYQGFSDIAGFSHVDQNGTAGYALLQDLNGKTYLNAPTGQSIEFRINNINIATLDVNAFYLASGKILAADTIRLSASNAPASAGANGAAGDIAYDASYIYICVGTNAWKRVAIATW